jgi:hypothetical protein
VRHERAVLHVGTLLSIHVHSYVSLYKLYAYSSVGTWSCTVTSLVFVKILRISNGYESNAIARHGRSLVILNECAVDRS